MGLGKSLVAIEAMARIKGKAVVVCPAFLKINWANEIVKFSKLRPIVLQSDTNFSDFDVAIVSYTSLHKFKNLFKDIKIVVSDECHMLKNLQAKRTQIFHNLLLENKPSYFIGLTGTAIKNRVSEFYSLLLLCSYCPTPTNGKRINDRFRNYYAFCDYFTHRTEFKIHGRKVVKYEGHRNVDELKLYLKGKYLRRRASQVLDLPPIIRKDIVLNETHVDLELKEAFENGGKVAFATAKVNSAKIKVKHTVKYAKDLHDEGNGPIVIFSAHVEPAEEIAASLKCTAITGKTSMEVRSQLVDKFQKGELPYLVATIGALSVGVTLTKSNNLIFNDVSFVPGDNAQAEKRIHRIGTTGTCIIHRMVYGKIDYHILKELDKKIRTLVKVL